MSAISFHGYHLHFSAVAIPGQPALPKMRGELMALQCSCPTILFVRQGDCLFVCDLIKLVVMKFDLPRKVSLGTIHNALDSAHERNNFSSSDLIGLYKTVDQVVAKLRRQYKRKNK